MDQEDAALVLNLLRCVNGMRESYTSQQREEIETAEKAAAEGRDPGVQLMGWDSSEKNEYGIRIGATVYWVPRLSLTAPTTNPPEWN